MVTTTPAKRGVPAPPVRGAGRVDAGAVGWRQSIALRYLAISLLAALVPLLVVWALYDRYSVSLIDSLTGERLDRRLGSMAGRVRAFLDARWYSLETLADYPELASLAAAGGDKLGREGLRAVIEFEADQPDLYGVLLFAEDGRLARAVPGQAAAGTPYWGRTPFPLDGVPRVATPRGVVIGPIPPGDGRAGSLLMLRQFSGSGPEGAGAIALHVRLASLTERMGPEDETGLFYPLLLTPDGVGYGTVGVPTPISGRLVRGAEVLPGWRLALVVKWEDLTAPLEGVRLAMVVAVTLVAVVLPIVFVLLFERARGRIARLVHGAGELAAGNLTWRLRSRGRDEIAVLAEAFNAMAERLQAVVRSTVEVEKMAVLGQFAAGVAHEVRNPLAAMKTSVQALAIAEHHRDRRAILDGIGEEIDRLDATLQDLLDFARPREPEFQATPIHPLVQRLLAMIQSQARTAGVAVVSSGACDVAVRVDPGQLQQIIMNLVLNGLQAMPQGGTLALKIVRREAVGIIEIIDDGVGIPAEALSKVTDPFFTTRPGGTGLGLAITRQLVERNGGTMTIESTPGRGTTVRLAFPLA